MCVCVCVCVCIYICILLLQPQEFDVEIELGHEEWSTSVTRSAISHASSRTVSAPQRGLTHDVYAAILHHLPSLVVALLKLLLAAGAMQSPILWLMQLLMWRTC